MRRILRIFITVAVLSTLTVIAIGYLHARQMADAQASVQILAETTVTRGNLTLSVSGTGTVTPIRQVALRFEASAPVSEIRVSDGQAVSKGDVLARLDTADIAAALQNAQIALQSQQTAYNALTAPARAVDVAAVQASLTAAQAAANAAGQGPTSQTLEIARLQTELARNQLWQVELQRDRVAPLPEPLRSVAAGITGGTQSNINQADYGVQLADTNYQGVQNQGPDLAGLSSASAAIVAAQVQLDRLVNGPSAYDRQMAAIRLQQAQLALDQAQTNLARSVLTAPFDGVITQLNLNIGETPPADEPAALLIDPGSFYVDLPLDETDIVDVLEGQTARLKLDALPDAPLIATVTRVALTPVNADQLVTYPVRVTLDPTDQPVRAGMSATGTIVVNELDDVLTLPNRFIRIDRLTQQAYVTIASDGGFVEVPVTLGLRNETDSQIVSGVSEGQRIVLLPRSTFDIFSGPPPGR